MSAQPIVEARLHVEFRGDGFRVWSRHRHYSGMFMDCEEIECTGMTMEDLLDTLTCLVMEIGPMGMALDERPF